MLVKPFKIKLAEKYLTKEDINILDVGAGSHSPTITKQWLPKCHYTAIDISKSYNNDQSDFNAMDEFIEMDLTKLEFGIIPENNYHLIVMSHVIEHLHNGDKVIAGLIPKLKKGGIIYLEFPSERSVNFPSKPETLNFYDDPTHCRIFSVKEVSEILVQNQMSILSAGIRKQLINIILMPFKIIYQSITKGYVRAGVYWDYYGFAEYVCARK
ncbi:MAG: methyltransferase domain-containing protein [Bacteroidetes bacterium]|nr:methyltransferase domain-containing protein [Bacteroidota bacterium]